MLYQKKRQSNRPLSVSDQSLMLYSIDAGGSFLGSLILVSFVGSNLPSFVGSNPPGAGLKLSLLGM